MPYEPKQKERGDPRKCLLNEEVLKEPEPMGKSWGSAERKEMG